MSVLKIKKPDGTWESINNNSIVEVDITLTQSGKAADAKVVGDAVSKLSSQMQIPGQVGQIIQVSAVDADGKVTAVEAVDAPDTRVPQFNLTSMGMPTVPVNGTPVHISGLDLTELFEAMMMGPVRITGALDFGVLPQIADDAGLVIGTTVVNPTYTTGGFLCVFHVASSDQTITALVSIDFIYSSGTITAMAKADSNAAEVPYFDLAAMGLPAVPVNGTEVSVSGVDLTGIAAAMQKGPVRVSHDFIDGDVTFKVSKTVTPVVQPGYIFADGVVVNNAGNISDTYSLGFYPATGTIRAVLKPYASSAGTGTIRAVCKPYESSAGTVPEADAFDPSVYDLPILALTGDTSAMTKDNAVTLDYEYGDRSGSCTVKWQGSSSLAYPKKNYTIKFDSGFEAVAGWGEQMKYCLKANYIDCSHARNVVSAKLWGQIVKTRSGVTGISADTMEESDACYSNEGDVLVAQAASSEAGIAFLKDLSVPEGGYTLTCEAYFPEGSENLEVMTQAYRVDTAVKTDVITATLSAAGVWETVELKTIWAAGSATLIALQGHATNGVKFRNIKLTENYTGAVYTFSPGDSRIKNLINGGAIDGFPCMVTLNGAFHGLYTFNIPKDGWMFGMGEGEKEAIVCANTHSAATRFKATSLLDGSDFELKYVSDESNADWVLESLNNLISLVSQSDGTNIDEIEKYVDLESAIDYYIFTVMIGGGDMTDKNYLLATYDGIRWFFSAYDMDSTYGINWDGKRFFAADDPAVRVSAFAETHKLMYLIKQYKTEALIARYQQLRATVLRDANIQGLYWNFAAAVPAAVQAADAQKWPGIPSTSVNNVQQILDWYRLRCTIIDEDMEHLITG